MQNYIKKYILGCLLLFIIVMLAGPISSYLSKNPSAKMSASVFEPSIIATIASTTSGYAWNDNVGWINFGDGNSSEKGRVYVSDNRLYGYAWGENIGWISLNCANTEANNCSTYGVTQNDGDGTLTGKAWGENVGWIDFAPNSNSVRISTSTGNFNGYAWGDNIGWISFSGTTQDSQAYGVNTEWRNLQIQTPPCTDFSYNPWSDCIDGSHTRTVATTSPIVCTGGNPVLTESCGVSRPICTYTYSDWGDCTRTQQTRTVSPDPSNCSNTPDQARTRDCVVDDESTTTATTTTPITINLSPASVSLHVNASTTFSANITGTTSDVLWSLSNSKAGTIQPLNSSTGLFIAGTATGTYHVIAKVENTPTKSATSTVTISSEDVVLPVGISIDPKKMEIYTGQSILFKSFINNTDNKNTTWIITEENGGTIDDNGLYTAPDITPNTVRTFHIMARSQADINKSDVAIITVKLRPKDAPATSTPIVTVTTPDTVAGNIVDTNNNNSNAPTSAGGSIPSTESGKNNAGIPAVLDISNLVTNNISVLGTTTERIVLGAKKIVESDAGSVVTKTITTAGVVGGGIAATGVLALNGTATADLLFLPFKLWGLLLSFLGLKKRNRPWGTVYDSVTKQPIDPAYVTISNLTRKEEDTSITDLDGRYGFLVSPGKYVLTANKTNYNFPSKKMLGKTEDTLYGNLYFGEEIRVATAGALINKNIPLDPIKFDWNEFVKGKKKLMKFYSRREKIVRMITDWIFRIGFAISVISLFLVTAPYNLVIFGLYVILALLRKFGLKQKALGSLTEKDGTPLSFAIIRAFSADLNIEITNKVVNRIGRYYCLVPKGKYFVKIEKKNDDESYTEIFTSKVFDAENGIINKNFII